MKPKRIRILPALLPLLTILTGCSTIMLHPIAKQDIVIMEKGESYTSDRDGYFLSNLYFDQVLKAKIRKVNLR